MSNVLSDDDHRQLVLAENICNLFCDLGPSTYDEIAPKIEYWIEFALTEYFTTTSDLAERVSPVAWDARGTHSDISRFLKEFHDAPHRSGRIKSFVDELCLHIVRWFAAASTEDLWEKWHIGLVSKRGGPGFMRAASFVGHLIECGLLSHERSELVHRFIFKPLTARFYNKEIYKKQSITATAIYQLFTAAGNTLLQGLLEPEVVQDCLKILETRILLGEVLGLDQFERTRLNAFRKIHTAWLRRKVEDQKRNVATDKILPEVETPVAFVPQDLPTTIDIGISSSILQGIEIPLILRDVVTSGAFTEDRTVTVTSPTFSISSLSDLNPTEFGEGIGESGDERTPTRHETFYLEDGNVEVVCGHTIFRLHSPIVSFSSPILRDMLSPSTLLNASMPEGCPRIVFKDSAEDFAVLLKMIYTPGFPTWREVPEFTIFASLLRMTTKYGFSNVREGLVEYLKGAYPTKWGDFETAKVLGEDVFGSPKPHPNAALNLFLEQDIRFALPFSAYRATLGGFSSLVSGEPGTALPRLTLASTVYGMDVTRGELSRLAHSTVCKMSLDGCCEGVCVLSAGNNPPERRTEALNRIYDAMVKEGKGDVLSSFSLGSIVCVNCAKTPEQAHRLWCAMIWAELPRIFGVGKSWEEV